MREFWVQKCARFCARFSLINIRIDKQCIIKTTQFHRAYMYNLQRIKIAFTFIFISIALTVSAFIYYRYGGYTYSITPTVVKDTVGEREFDINISGRGWYDTGLWIKSGQSAIADTKNNPFILMIDSFRDYAKMNDFNNFAAALTAYENPTNYTDVAIIKNQGKIYLFSEYPATIHLRIIVDPAATSRFEKEKEPSSQEIPQKVVPEKEQSHSSGWIAWTLILIVSLVISGIIVCFVLEITDNKIKWSKDFNAKGINIILGGVGIFGIMLSYPIMLLITRLLIWIGLYSF